jgi:hypothetical protein
MCLDETYRTCIGKNRSDKFPVQNGLKQDAVSPLLFSFGLEFSIRMVQDNLEGWNWMEPISFWPMPMMLI